MERISGECTPLSFEIWAKLKHTRPIMWTYGQIWTKKLPQNKYFVIKFQVSIEILS